MKKVRLSTIKSKLSIIAISIAVIWVVLVFILYKNLNRIREHDNLTTAVNNFSVNIIKLRKAENNFLLIEQTNPYFYTTGKSKFIDKFNIQLTRCENNVNELINNEITIDFKQVSKLQLIKRNLKDYNESFNNLVKNIRERGYLDYGYIGEMNASVQKTEALIATYNENFNTLNEKLLILRKYEKDFLSLKDYIYYENFQSTVETYRKFFRDVRTTLSRQEINRFLEQLMIYKEKFERVVKKEELIGLSVDDGLIGETQIVINRVEKDVEDLLLQMKQKNSEAITRTKYSLFFTVGVLAFLVVAALLIVGNSITSPILKIKSYIKELVKGKFPESIILRNDDEISEMAESLNIFVQNLREKARFSQQIGRGEYNTEFTVASKEDTLGNALLKMRNDLKKAAEEDIKRKKDDEKQVWATQGLAKFNDILRQNKENINEFAYDIIKNLVNFINANQGGVFIYNDDNPDDIYLELVAAFAYNKRKLDKKKIKLKEGIVGTCAIEKATSYITEVPEDYINIKSGLGTSNPKSLLIVPLVLNELIFGVIELASFDDFKPHEISFVEKLSENIAATLSVVKTNERTRTLLKQYQEQKEDLLSKEEEMRQNLEELRAIQENLALQEADMSALQFAMNNAIITAEFEPNGKVIKINTKFTESTGYTEKDLVGENISITLHGKEKEKFDEIWLNLLEGKTFKGILKSRVKSGQERWFHVTYTPIKDEYEKITKVIYLGQDITDIKRLELELYDREASLEIKIKRLETEIQVLKKEIEIKSHNRSNPIRSQNV